MKTIILPGYSVRNKDWADETARKLNLDHDIIVHNWKHWSPAQRAFGSARSFGSMSIKFELDKIRKRVGKENFNIIGKSVGARMTIRVISELKENVNKVILCGIASVSEDNKKAYVKALVDFPEENIIFFQNTKDPFVPYFDVDKFIHAINSKIAVIEKPGSEHHYPYFEDFQNFLK